MTKTNFRKALAVVDHGASYRYAELGQSGTRYEYLFFRDRVGYTLRNESTGNTVFVGYRRKPAEDIMVH